MKLALGTVQFGIPYGIANKFGQVTEQQASDILECARLGGITHLDTAIAYGESEIVLGKIGVSWAKVITKLPPISTDVENIEAWVQDHITNSMERLKLKQLEAVMLHRASDLLNQNGEILYRALQDLKKTGTISKIGYSIYNPADLDACYKNYKPDVIQAPFNLFDRRLEESNWLAKLNADNVEVHVRSVFLQGLLLMKPESRPQKFKKWLDNFSAFDHWLKVENLTAVEASLGFVNNHNLVDKIIVGADNSNQLLELLNHAQIQISKAPEIISSTDEGLINPSHWNNDDKRNKKNRNYR